MEDVKDKKNKENKEDPESDSSSDQKSEEIMEVNTSVSSESAGDEKTEDDGQPSIPGTLPVLPVRDIVIFPNMILPLFVGRDLSIKAIDHALSVNRMILLVAQKDLNVENPKPEDLFKMGTVGMIIRMLKLPDGRIKILVQGLTRARILNYVQTEPFFSTDIEQVNDPLNLKVGIQEEALIRTVKQQLEKVVQLGKPVVPDIMAVLENLEEPGRVADLVASNLGLKVEQAQEILEVTDPIARLKKVNDVLGREIELLQVQQKIQSDARGEIDRSQRDYYLREQLKAIQKELGEADERGEEIQELKEKIAAAQMPENVLKEAEKQVRRLEKMHPDSAEAGTIRTYIDWLAEVPWAKATEDHLDIRKAKKVLDEDHYDLEKVKERLLEYLAVRKLNATMKGPILCFVGPPGVGKTSLGKSIARALGREFVRMSVGGTRDEAEIRGHRRTYVGALPGRIMQGLKNAGTNNPVFMIDEVDKLGSDFRGDPSSALLEVLDPEQNFAFVDHYLAVPFDLSKVMFITTANQLDPIPPPLRDRMEVIYLSGYATEEKIGIARNYLIPKQLKEHGITEKQIRIEDKGLMATIEQYTREAGVRNLDREIANLCRKVARKIAEGKSRLYRIDGKNIHTFLGSPKVLPEAGRKKSEVGVAVGLAWTETGGDTLYIEATTMKGKGQLSLTGHLGDVMKESAQAALTYIRSRAGRIGIGEQSFAEQDIHVHVPAGAIPKDGPSAGITMATALASVLTGKPVRKDVAMTGEITLRGRVLPIGGLKEKSLAARRAGMTTVVLPKLNRKDIDEIPAHLRKDMNFVFVENMDEVLSVALEVKETAKAKSPRKKAKVGGAAGSRKGSRKR